MKKMNLKTILLLIIMIVMLFSLFVALPGIVPAFDTADLDKVIWACTLRGQPPVKYDTWIWTEPVMPEGQRGNNMDVIQNPENEDEYTVRGYLHYGEFIKPEGDGAFVMPIPKQIGVMKNTGMVIELTHVYDDQAESEIIRLKTDDRGKFEQSIVIDPTSECFRVKVTFGMRIIEPKDLRKPVEIYFGCQKDYTDCPPFLVERAMRSRHWWPYLVGGILFIVLAIIGYWYVKSRVRFGVAVEGIEELDESPGLELEKDVSAGGDTELMEILFPDILATLPSVWGVNEHLEVTVRALEGGDVSGTIDIDWDDGTSERCQPDNTGAATLHHVYEKDGTCTITASYRSLSGEIASSWRKIRIVIYREEIVRLFEEMLQVLKMEVAIIKPEMTPREVERLLINTIQSVSVKTVRRLVRAFEEANYSTHRTAREHYIAMYQAIQEVIDNDG